MDDGCRVWEGKGEIPSAFEGLLVMPQDIISDKFCILVAQR
ncbi:MAG: hypothetical protein ACHBN1_19785 [Heteroscytonema crispum UTEX LB 1556]